MFSLTHTALSAGGAYTIQQHLHAERVHYTPFDLCGVPALPCAFEVLRAVDLPEGWLDSTGETLDSLHVPGVTARVTHLAAALLPELHAGAGTVTAGQFDVDGAPVLSWVDLGPQTPGAGQDQVRAYATTVIDPAALRTLLDRCAGTLREEVLARLGGAVPAPAARVLH